MCARVVNQRSRGVVIARLRSSIQSLLHQCRDFHQQTYIYLSEDQEQTSHQDHPKSWCTCVLLITTPYTV
jgi:hypothetical protein